MFNVVLSLVSCALSVAVVVFGLVELRNWGERGIVRRRALIGVLCVQALMGALCFALAIWLATTAAPAHEIYLGLHGRNGQLCCGGEDCALTVYREHGGTYEFLTRENEWVALPEDRITFLPIPGDPPHDDGHAAHLCYRTATESDRAGYAKTNVFGSIFLYCAFIPPGSI